jgi:hypothetical protein
MLSTSILRPTPAKTLGELRQLVAKLPDDTPLTSDGGEQVVALVHCTDDGSQLIITMDPFLS